MGAQLKGIASQHAQGFRRCALLPVVAVVLSTIGCRAKLSVTTTGGANVAGAQGTFKVTGVSKVVTTPGETLTLSGLNFRPTMAVAKLASQNLVDTAQALDGGSSAALAVQSGSAATVALPVSQPFGPYTLTLTEDGATQNVALFSNGGKTDFPVFIGTQDQVCAGQKYYDTTGMLRVGTKSCATTAPNCASDGATGCLATTTYAAALTTGAAAKIVAGNTLAGVAGAATASSASACASDGATGCLATTTYAAALTTGAAAKILAGKTLAGISGTASTSSANACASDGATACLAASPYVAALITGLASKVLSGNTVAGVAGSVTLPAASNVLTTVNYGAGGTAATGSLTLPTAANVRATNGAYGAGGNSLTPTLSNCAADGSINCVATASFTAAQMSAFGSGDIRSGVTVAGVAGALAGPPASCSSDGAVGCLAAAPYVAAFTTGLADKVLNANTVAGVAGDVTLPSASNVLTTITYGIGGTAVTGTLTIPTAGNVLSGSGVFGVGGSSVTPTLTLPAAGNVSVANGAYGVAGTGSTPTLANCAADGATACVATATYTAALTTTLAPKIVSGNTVAGVAGTTAAAPANCSADGGTACVAVASYTAAATTGLANKVLSGNTVAGIAGNVTLPPVGDVLTTISYGTGGTAATGTLTLPTAGNVLSGSGVFGVGGSSVTPTLTLPATANVRTTNGSYGVSGTASTPTLANCATDAATGCVAVAGYPAANTATFAGSNIQSGYTVAGVVGSGTISSSCTTDGQQNCSVSGVFKAANVTGIGTWDLRAGLTMGGISGALKTNCRNTITSATFNYDGALASLPNTSTATGTILDYWDTIDDYLGFAASKVTAWSSNTLCDSTTWTDVTTTDGGVSNVACGTSSTCIYKDQISNLQVTGILQSGNYNQTSTSSPESSLAWNAAQQACAGSTYGGYAAGTWRLPTQKELMSIYEHGVTSLANADFITLANMNALYFMSSTTYANVSTDNLWYVSLAYGYTRANSKAFGYYIVCVK